ncbi:Chitin Hypothetical protein Peritrophin-A domain [Nesidiocoris tenuis]|uniref:Chitin-binding type-2 domain-containing protein n=1 Tax=Nesidiocoris tenuis TaxID=355587 RepID=A0ABN7AJT1_9HEMI|nr:Chitin Hypothetical protein Peritrophin-A domain [Nesidiocoris tenuis]
MYAVNMWLRVVIVLSFGTGILAQVGLTECGNPCPLCPAFMPDEQIAYFPRVGGSSSDFVYCNGETSVTRYMNISCPADFVFNPRTSADDDRPLCVPAQSSAVPDSGCSRQNNVRVPCYGNPMLYCTCVNGVATSLSRCPVGQIFDNQTKTCMVRCTQSGVFGFSAVEEPEGPLTEYYTCLFNQITWLYSLTYSTCPTNTMFDTTYSFCLPSGPDGGG